MSYIQVISKEHDMNFQTMDTLLQMNKENSNIFESIH